MSIEMIINKDNCKGCGLCISVCPLKLLAIDKSVTNNKGYHVACNTAVEKCIGCASCAITCPDAAIAIRKE